MFFFITPTLCPSLSHLSSLLSPLLLLHIVTELGWHAYVLAHEWLLHSLWHSLLHWLSTLLHISFGLLHVVTKLLPAAVVLLYPILLLAKLLLIAPLLLLGRLLTLGLPLILAPASPSNGAEYNGLIDCALGSTI